MAHVGNKFRLKPRRFQRDFMCRDELPGLQRQKLRLFPGFRICQEQVRVRLFQIIRLSDQHVFRAFSLCDVDDRALIVDDRAVPASNGMRVFHYDDFLSVLPYEPQFSPAHLAGFHELP